MKHYTKVVDAIINNCWGNKSKEDIVIQAVKYVGPKEVIRATRRLFAKGKGMRKGENVEIFLTFGKPNYREREFIKLCLKAKEPFPVKNVQLKFKK